MGNGEHNTGALPARDQLAYNPLFDDPTRTPARSSTGPGASPEPSGGQGGRRASALPDAPAAMAAACESAAALTPYLELLKTLAATLERAASGSSGGSGNVHAAPFPDAPATTGDEKQGSSASSLREHVQRTEARLMALCNALAQRGHSGPSRHGSFDLMRSLSSDNTPTSQSGTPSRSGMAALSSILTSLLDTHKAQLRRLQSHVQAAERQQRGDATADAAAALKEGFREIRGHAEAAREELRRLTEMNGQQESEVAIQWTEKQALQQQSHAELASVRQVHTMRSFAA